MSGIPWLVMDNKAATIGRGVASRDIACGTAFREPRPLAAALVGRPYAGPGSTSRALRFLA